MVALEKKYHFYAIVHVAELGKTAEYTFPLVACRAPAKSVRAREEAAISVQPNPFKPCV